MFARGMTCHLSPSPSDAILGGGGGGNVGGVFSPERTAHLCPSFNDLKTAHTRLYSIPETFPVDS
jgi:hypothetical protein